MSEADHYKEAERILAIASDLTAEVVDHAAKKGITSAEMQVMASHAANLVASAQVHATLALADAMGAVANRTGAP